MGSDEATEVTSRSRHGLSDFGDDILVNSCFTCAVCVDDTYSVAELELRCRSLNTELSELRQSLAAEHQHRSHAEDMLRQAHEQLQIQQQLTAHTSEQVSGW